MMMLLMPTTTRGTMAPPEPRIQTRWPRRTLLRPCSCMCGRIAAGGGGVNVRGFAAHGNLSTEGVSTSPGLEWHACEPRGGHEPPDRLAGHRRARVGLWDRGGGNSIASARFFGGAVVTFDCLRAFASAFRVVVGSTTTESVSPTTTSAADRSSDSMMMKNRAQRKPM
jgi:hypothetical protein